MRITIKSQPSLSLCLMIFLFIMTAASEAVAQASYKPTEKGKPLDYHRHMARLEKRLEGMGFHIMLQKPFVVIGDGPVQRVKYRAEKTVRWAVDLLKKDFFEKNPDRILGWDFIVILIELPYEWSGTYIGFRFIPGQACLTTTL